MKHLLISWAGVLFVTVILVGIAVGVVFLRPPTTEIENEKYHWQDTKYAHIRTKIASARTNRVNSTVEYPVTENKQVNDIIAAKINEFHSEFRDEIRTRTPESGQKFEQNISYQVVRQNKTYLSLAVTAFRTNITRYPKRETAYWTFDMQTGRALTLRDIFDDRADDGIARVILYIKQSLAAKQVSAGSGHDLTAADKVLTPEYIRHFLTPDPLTLRFDFRPGEVADPKMGSMSISLPIDNLHLFMQNDRAKSLFSVVPIGHAARYEPKKVEGITAPDCAKAKCIALTFDDGPSNYTSQLLDTLRDKKAHASFFLVGNNIAKHPSIVKRESAEGHTVANHSWSHPRLTRLSEEEIVAQLTKTNDAIFSLTNTRPTYMRPPNGAVNQTVYTAIEKLNMTAVLWSIDTRDWADRNSQIISNRVIASARPGAIIILHDVHKTSVVAVSKIIDTLQKNGYTFVSLEEMLGQNAVPGKAVYRAA